VTTPNQTWSVYRAAIQRMKVVVFAFDRDGVLTVNEGGGLDVLGILPGEAVGRSVFDIYAHREDLCAAFREVLGGDVVRRELTAAGEIFDATFLPIIEAGGVAGGLGFGVVVTPQRQAANSLARRSRHTAAIAEMARLAVEAGEDLPAVWHAVTLTATDLLADVAVIHVLDATGQWAQAVAYHHRKPWMRDVLDGTLIPYRVPARLAPIAELLVTGEPVEWKVVAEELRRFVGDGAWEKVRRELPETFLLVPLRARGRIIGHLSLGRDQGCWPEEDRALAVELADRAGMVVDNARMRVALRHELAERRRVETALRRSLREQSVVAQLSTAVISGASVTDVAQQAAEAIYAGLEADSCQVFELLRGSSELRVIAAVGDPLGRRAPDVHRIVRETVEAARPVVVEGQATRAAGPDAVGAAISAPLQISAERLGAIIAVSASPRTVEPHETLYVETVGNVISAAMQQQRAALAEQRAAEAERLAAIGRVAAGMAHDYDNILMAIRLYADLLREQEGLDALGRRRLGAISSQVDLASDMAARVLDYARGGQLERDTLDLGELVGEELAVAREVMPPDVEIEVDVRGSRSVSADGTRLRQVLLNLLANATDAMPTGGRLTVRVGDCDGDGHAMPQGTVEGPNGWVCLEVADTGVGMTADTLQRVPEPFFTTKLPGKGTGLGLAQAHTIVRQHGGHLEIDSEVGRGTRVRIWLEAAACATRGCGTDEGGRRGPR
jgi:signal transduction histidine kinase